MNASQGFQVKIPGGREETDILFSTIPKPPSAPPRETVSLIHAVYGHMISPADCIQTGLVRKLWHIIGLHSEVHEVLAGRYHMKVLQSNARKANLRSTLDKLREEYKNICAERAGASERSCGNLDAVTESRKEMRALSTTARKTRRDTRFWNAVTVPLNGMGRREQRLREAERAQDAAENAGRYYEARKTGFRESIEQWRDMFEKARRKVGEIENCEAELERQNGRGQRWREESLKEMQWAGFWEVLRERMEEGWERNEIGVWVRWCERCGCNDDTQALSIDLVTAQCDEMANDLVRVCDEARNGKSRC